MASLLRNDKCCLLSPMISDFDESIVSSIYLFDKLWINFVLLADNEIQNILKTAMPLEYDVKIINR